LVGDFGVGEFSHGRSGAVRIVRFR
jgi:hypothetical protein